MAEYIEREAAIETVERYFEKILELYPDICLDGIRSLPAADVVERPEGITADRMAEIIRAEIEGRLKMSKPPLEETCGSCKHFHPYPGMATGPCDCRVKLDRWRQPTSQVLYVSQSRVRCRDDYEPREGGA